MPEATGREGMTPAPVELSRTECEDLLGSALVGRVAFEAANGIEILPVNYLLAHGAIWFRTLPYGVLAQSAAAGQDMVFQVDHHDDMFATGWSVLVRGRVTLPEDDSEGDEIRASARPRPWAGRDRTLVLRLVPRTMTGRRVRAGN